VGLPGGLPAAGSWHVRCVKRYDAVEQRDVLALAALTSARSGNVRIGIDMVGVVEIDNTDLRELLRISKDLGAVGASVVVMNPSDRVRKTLDVTGLVKVFPVGDAHSAPAEVFAWNLR
jgi:anti-anti-sigma factor